MDKDWNISKHLKWSEVRCKGDGCCEGGRLTVNTVELFEVIRSQVGIALGEEVPIYVNSGFRCPKHNRKVGGSKNSLHMMGMAMDLRTPEGMSNEMFYIVCCLCNPNGGNGIYPWGCHVDTGKRRRWRG